MDSHVKERIVGAAVLVALGVWLIPWVLDGRSSGPEPTAPAAESDLELPSPDQATPVRTETVELSSRSDASRYTPDAAAPVAAADEPPSVVRNLQDPAPRPVEQPAQRPAEMPSERPAPPPAAAGERAAWSVQVGAFSERANAVQLAGRVAVYGHEAEVTEFRSNGLPMHRVRVEGFATRAQAEAVGSSLSAHGIPAQVVPAD